MYICLHICACIHTIELISYIYVYICVFVCVYVNMYIYIQYSYIYVICICILCIYICVYIHLYICRCTFIYSYVYVYICMGVTLRFETSISIFFWTPHVKSFANLNLTKCHQSYAMFLCTQICMDLNPESGKIQYHFGNQTVPHAQNFSHLHFVSVS